MKFVKDLKSQMVPEWQAAYMDYAFLKTLLKDIQKTRPPPANPPGLPRALTLYRAFSGLTQRNSSPRSPQIEQDIESQPILINSVKRSDGEDGYVTTFLMSHDQGGEYELVYFRRLDDEFNKVVKFYKEKVEEVMKEADELNKQMDALIAFRIKVDNPQHVWFDTAVDMNRLASSTSVLLASSPRMRTSRKVADHMDVIDEDRSCTGDRADEICSDLDITQAKEARILNQNFKELSRSISNTTRIGSRPAPLEVLSRVTLNNNDDTPLTTIKGVLNVPIQTDLEFSKENLNKVQDQLQRAFIEFYHKLRLLKSYSFLNILAFSKIMKKYDKITSRNASKSYMKMVDNSYLGSSDEVTKLMDRVEVAFIKHFSNSNSKKGFHKLRPKAKRERHSLTASLGYLAGFASALVVALILIIRSRNLVEKDGSDQYMKTMFPLYSFFGFIVLHMFLYAGNIYFWRRYRINYNFIFGFKSGTTLGYREVLLLGFGLLVLALGCILANLDMEMDPKTGNYKDITELLPLVLVILLFVIMFCPFNIIYRSTRFFLLTCLIHCLLTPLYKVVLTDVFLADQLSSNIQAFRSFEFYICYYSSGDYKHRENNCNKNLTYSTFNYILAAVPFWWRFLQCIRRYFEEKDGMQGLNSLKYFAIIVSIVTRTAYTRSKSDEWLIVAWITSGVAAVAATYWDIVYDWGLLQRKSNNPWLRDKLLVPHKSVYFAAIVLNVVLRLAWIQAVLDFNLSFLHKESMITIVASLEIIRRAVWNFFRLENEHLNNVGKYRAFKSVPLPFNYDGDQD